MHTVYIRSVYIRESHLYDMNEQGVSRKGAVCILHYCTMSKALGSGWHTGLKEWIADTTGCMSAC